MYLHSKIKEVLIIVGIGLVWSLLLSFLSGWGLLMLVNLVGLYVSIISVQLSAFVYENS